MLTYLYKAHINCILAFLICKYDRIIVIKFIAHIQYVIYIIMYICQIKYQSCFTIHCCIFLPYPFLCFQA